MPDTPLYSIELRKLRGSITVIDLAERCGVSREAIRLVENGALLPGKNLLFSWLACTETAPLFRVDILQDIIRRKVEQSTLAREIEELKEIAYPSSFEDPTGLIEELTDIFMEVGSLKDSMREGQYMRIKRVFDRHTTEKATNDE